MSSLSPNHGRTRRTSQSRKSSRRSRKTQSLSPNYRYHLFELCKKDFFSVLPDNFIAYKTKIVKAFEKHESIVNNTNKYGETPLDLLCKQYNDPKNKEKFVGVDDRQSLLSLIEDLQYTYGAKLKKCSL